MPEKPLTVPCPTCGKAAPFTPDNAFRPFCSKRCKQIDMGEWASESYRVAGNNLPPEEQNAED